MRIFVICCHLTPKLGGVCGWGDHLLIHHWHCQSPSRMRHGNEPTLLLHCMTKLGNICDEIRPKPTNLYIQDCYFQIAITNLLITQMNIFLMYKCKHWFHLSYDVSFINIGFVFWTWWHYYKKCDEIWCIDGTLDYIALLWCSLKYL